jgi:threonine/homoserine/homoserine lactone efflux protein
VTATHFLSLYLFALVASGTPGPNNIMLMASGVNFGLRRSLPHLLGAWVGVPLLMLAIGYGLYGLLVAFPWLLTVLHLVALVYLLYLAWRIATTGAPDSGGRTAARPFTFLQAAAFQLLNVKMWMMGVTAMTMFSRADHFATDVAFIAAAFPLANGPCLLGWTIFGTMMRRVLSSGYAVRVFNVGMAILLLLSLLPVLLGRVH